jgi:hypothetical protein
VGDDELLAKLGAGAYWMDKKAAHAQTEKISLSFFLHFIKRCVPTSGPSKRGGQLGSRQPGARRFSRQRWRHGTTKKRRYFLFGKEKITKPHQFLVYSQE